jgi:hypothetical protein
LSRARANEPGEWPLFRKRLTDEMRPQLWIASAAELMPPTSRKKKIEKAYPATMTIQLHTPPSS